MDLSALLGSLISDKTVTEVSRKSGASKKDVSSVLTTALPLLLSSGSNTTAAQVSEESRRMEDMMKMYNMYGMDPSMFGGQETLTLNANNALVSYLVSNKDAANTEMFAKQLYDLAKLSNQPLNPEDMAAFVQRTNKIMMLLAK